MEDYWIKNIHEMIEGYANIEQQRQAWVESDNSIISSYDEDWNMLFFSFCFDDFMEEWRKENLDKKILKEMIIFRDMLNAYDRKLLKDQNYLPDKDVLEDPEWLSVVNQAKKIIKLWPPVHRRV